MPCGWYAGGLSLGVGRLTRDMSGWRRGVVLAVAAWAGASAQMHKVAKPEKVVRAVGVYEWTGDLGHPTASRLVPVSLFIDGDLADAGVYLARPVPFALGSGTEYELESGGLAKGDVALESAARVQTPDDAYTDGWIGYGSYRAPVETVARAVPGKVRPGSMSGTIKVADADNAKPNLASRTDEATKGKGASGSGTGDAAGSGTGSGASGTDGDRPTMRRRSDAGDAGSGAGSGSAGSSGAGGDTAGDDPADRPTLKRRTPEAAADVKKEKKKKQQTASVTGVGSLNDDPDRPMLHRGGAAGAEGADRDVPKLMGLPPDLHQMVAVSDAATRDAHPFARPWEGEDERLAVLAKMRGMAVAQMAAYAKKAGAAKAAASAVGGSGSGGAAASGVGAGTGASASGAVGGAVPRLRPGAGSGVKTRRLGTGAAATPALVDEEVRGFLLSYGGAPTYVYMAHTAGQGDALRYVTVVAQVGAAGELQQAMASVTDAAHLDRTPWMRLVDAVDAEASNRASLLFELRGREARQFALYRVLGGRSDQMFTTGTTE